MIRRRGCRAHDYGRASIETLVEQIRVDGYTTTQLALKKALIDVDDFGKVLNPEYASHIKKVMSKASVDISVLGAYLNYTHPDEMIRTQNIDILKGHIKIAKTMGARMVGTETGSLDMSYKPHPKNHGEEGFIRFQDAITQVLPVVDMMETYMAIEPVSHHIIHTPKRMFDFVKAVNHPRLKVIFDISNLMTKDNVDEQESMIHEMFDLMEQDILAVHVKDFDILHGEKVIVPLGQGRLIVETLMERVKKSPVKVDVLAENVERNLLHLTSEMLQEI